MNGWNGRQAVSKTWAKQSGVAAEVPIVHEGTERGGMSLSMESGTPQKIQLLSSGGMRSVRLPSLNDVGLLSATTGTGDKISDQSTLPARTKMTAPFCLNSSAELLSLILHSGVKRTVAVASCD